MRDETKRSAVVEKAKEWTPLDDVQKRRSKRVSRQIVDDEGEEEEDEEEDEEDEECDCEPDGADE